MKGNRLISKWIRISVK